jgi:hypothetical protein
MKKTFIFKHYWDKGDASAKLIPEWLSQGDSKLSSEQIKLQELARELTSPFRYAQLSKNRYGNLNINGYYVYYQCEKDKDPDQTNNRQVTNITFCVSRKNINKDDCKWEVSETYIPEKKQSYKKYVIVILATLSILATVLLYMGLNNTENNIDKNEIISNINDYSVLVDQWNEAAIKNNLSDKYILPRDNNSENIVKKLNSILSAYAKDTQTLNLCTKKKDNHKFYIPVRDYCQFIASKKSKNNIYLTAEMDEERMISMIKSITNHPYINRKMLLDTAFLNSFEIYFNYNLEEFYKKGFSRNIKTYAVYLDMIEQFN